MGQHARNALAAPTKLDRKNSLKAVIMQRRRVLNSQLQQPAHPALRKALHRLLEMRITEMVIVTASLKNR